METNAKPASPAALPDLGNIDLMRPLLPDAEAILPYIKRIDSSRWYSNFGPLVMELQERMKSHFCSGVECVTASSGTAGLISTIRAMNLPHNSYCLMPSWTFVGTPATAMAAGMTPYFIDVDNDTWALEPEYVKRIIKNIRGVIGAVIVVAPFGRIIDVEAWDKFSYDTSIPVVIDAAAGFDWFRNSPMGKTPVVISLHATKVMGVGEGGLVLCRDSALIRHVQEQTNFGFYTRHVSTPGINCKMSEYAAAVAHAALDQWTDKRRQWEKTTHLYMDALEPLAEKYGFELWLDRENVVSTCNIRLGDNIADRVISQLRVYGIKARRWWDDGCHRQPAYAGFPREDLTVTENISSSLVSLPFYIDIPEDHIAFTSGKLAQILKG